MMTKTLSNDNLKTLMADDFLANPANQEMVVYILSNGGVIIAPTETKYALVANAESQKSLDKLYSIKNRQEKLPTAIFVSSKKQLCEIGDMNKGAEKLAENFLPGPLTLILNQKSSNNNLDFRIALDGKIGFRLSSSRVISELVESSDFLLTATSANISGKKEPDNISALIELFGDLVDYYIDGGVLNSEPSTVVDCTTDELTILREGTITQADINSLMNKDCD